MNLLDPSRKISLRKLVPEDSRLIFEWRNSDFIRKQGINKNKVTWDEHQKWIQSYFKSKRKLLFIIECCSERIGQLRFDINSRNSKEAFVSIYLIEQYTRKGFGAKALLISLPLVFSYFKKITAIRAVVRRDNLASIRLFEKCLFEKEVGKGNDRSLGREFLVYSYSRSEKHEIAHNKPSFDEKEATAALKVIQSGKWCVGNTVRRVEKELCHLTKRKHCILVGSGLAALRLSLLAIGVGRDDKVAVPAYSCVALANAALSIGAEPVAVDIERESLNLKNSLLASSNYSGVKAAILVHTFGRPCEIGRIRGIKTIEDCSHGFLRGNMASLADVAVISFYVTKFIAGAMGGAILTDDDVIADRLVDYRDYVDKAPSLNRLNDRISDIHAALIEAQLSKVNSIIMQRELAAQRYYEFLAPISEILQELGVEIPAFSRERVWYRFPIRMKKNVQAFIEKIRKYKITVARPITCWLNELRKYPEASKAFDEIVSLPFFCSISREEQRYVCRKTIEVLSCHE